MRYAGAAEVDVMSSLRFMSSYKESSATTITTTSLLQCGAQWENVGMGNENVIKQLNTNTLYKHTYIHIHVKNFSAQF